MNNVRGLYPPLFGAAPSGGGSGGGGGQHIQVDALPEASLQYKDKIVQYVGATTETLTNGYFYKCVEHTETEGETITVTYSWDSIDVMNVSSGGLVKVGEEVGDGTKRYYKLIQDLMDSFTLTDSIYIAKLGTTIFYQNVVDISANTIDMFAFKVSDNGSSSNGCLFMGKTGTSVYLKRPTDSSVIHNSVAPEGTKLILYKMESEV